MPIKTDQEHSDDKVVWVTLRYVDDLKRLLEHQDKPYKLKKAIIGDNPSEEIVFTDFLEFEKWKHINGRIIAPADKCKVPNKIYPLKSL